ncbi:MAG: hypothetical protein AAFZ65_17165, partial [Planctomycetota bacterium]
ALELGQPFSLGIAVEHPHGSRVEFEAEAYSLDAGWLVFDDDHPLTVEAADGEGLVTRFGLELAAIEQRLVQTEEGIAWSSQRPLDPPRLTLVRGAERTELPVEAPELELTALIELEESLPRPIPPLVEVKGSGWTPDADFLLLSNLAIVLIALASVLTLRLAERARRAEGPQEPIDEARTVVQRLRDEGIVRDRVFEAARVVRRAVDEQVGRQGAGLADDEWLESLPRDGHWLPLRARIAEFLGRATRVRYADSEPTEWAIEELVNEAAEIVERVVALGPELAAPSEVPA